MNSVDSVSYITDTGPSSGNVVRPRSRIVSDAPVLSLDGDWRFRLLQSAPGSPGDTGVLPLGETVDSVASPDLDDSEWATMAVPAHWVLAGGPDTRLPIYTNVQFPFATEAPRVPDANPTGDYRRHFDVPPEWLYAESFEAIWLRFDGVESRYKVWINGSEVGVGVGSRLTNEFDVSNHVRPGKNLIAVRVHQWSASSYVEDQDQWWLPGIFRSVTVHARPTGGIDDAWIQADYDSATGTGMMIPELVASARAFPVTFSIPSLGVEYVWDDPDDVSGFNLGPVHAWSADTPYLYEAFVRSASERITLKLGFRNVQITGDQFQVNGRTVAFHGVNRHDSDPDHGRVFDEDKTRRDLLMMKRYNVNAIRTSHYPPHSRLLDIADELGFWVIVECDLETHGFEHIDEINPWIGNPVADPAWRRALLERIERTVERDKNHPSVIMWSLGNEAGTGENLAAMASWVHSNDPSRPVHYEGDHTGSYTDVYSRMYATIPELHAIGRQGDTSLLLNCSAAESARQRTKPFMLCEYAHAMGNGPGGLEQYEQLFDLYPRLHGGFVWEWRDHGLTSRTSSGEPFFAYGGDFGEEVHDGNFVMDGLTMSDGRPTPALHEFAAVASPIRFTSSAPSSHIRIDNNRHSGGTSDLAFHWSLSEDGHDVAEGEIVVGNIVAGDFADVAVVIPEPSATKETWLTISARLAADALWAPAGHLVAFRQFDLTPPQVRANRLGVRRFGVLRDRQPAQTKGDGSPSGAPRSSNGDITLGPAAFRGGRLRQLHGHAVAGPRLELWRAPTDNDEGSIVAGSFDRADPYSGDGRGIPAPAHAEDWRRKGLDRLVGRTVSVGETPTSVQRLTRWSAANIREGVYLHEHWQSVDDAVVLRLEFEPTDGWDIVWPRLGVRFDLRQRIDQIVWFGAGPHESYPDSARAAQVGQFRARTADLAFPYARPQESGHRSDLRTLDLIGEVSTLRIETSQDHRGRLPGFSISKNTAQQMSSVRHLHELPSSETTYLYLDAAQNGLGSRSCGPDVWPDFILRPESRSMVMKFTAFIDR